MDEILTEVVFPPLSPRSGWAALEVSRRHGNFALVGVAALVVLDAGGVCSHARLAFFGVSDGPLPALQAAQALTGQRLTPAVVAEAADLAATKDVDPPGDIHATAAFRRHLTRVLARRALTIAGERAAGRSAEGGRFPSEGG